MAGGKPALHVLAVVPELVTEKGLEVLFFDRPDEPVPDDQAQKDVESDFPGQEEEGDGEALAQARDGHGIPDVGVGSLNDEPGGCVERNGGAEAAGGHDVAAVKSKRAEEGEEEDGEPLDWPQGKRGRPFPDREQDEAGDEQEGEKPGDEALQVGLEKDDANWLIPAAGNELLAKEEMDVEDGAKEHDDGAEKAAAVHDRGGEAVKGGVEEAAEDDGSGDLSCARAGKERAHRDHDQVREGEVEEGVLGKAVEGEIAVEVRQEENAQPPDEDHDGLEDVTAAAAGF